MGNKTKEMYYSLLVTPPSLGAKYEVQHIEIGLFCLRVGKIESSLGDMAFFADVLLASHAILPFLVGRGTRDEALRKFAWEAIGDSRG